MILWKSADGLTEVERTGEELFLVRKIPMNEAAHALFEAVRDAVRLTKREQDVLSGIKESLANKEIGARLHMSERTVKFHVTRLLAKFRCQSRHELIFR